jgi:hypothetical protein
MWQSTAFHSGCLTLRSGIKNFGDGGLNFVNTRVVPRRNCKVLSRGQIEGLIAIFINSQFQLPKQGLNLRNVKELCAGFWTRQATSPRKLTYSSLWTTVRIYFSVKHQSQVRAIWPRDLICASEQLLLSKKWFQVCNTVSDCIELNFQFVLQIYNIPVLYFSSNANRSSANKEISLLLCSRCLRNRVHHSPTLEHIPRHMNQFHIVTTYSVRSILILTSHICLSVPSDMCF